MGVLRDAVRAPQPPTNRAPNEPTRSICAQESIFCAKFGLFWAKNPNFCGRKGKFWYPWFCLLYVVGVQSEFGACISINILEGALHFTF